MLSDHFTPCLSTSYQDITQTQWQARNLMAALLKRDPALPLQTLPWPSSPCAVVSPLPIFISTPWWVLKERQHLGLQWVSVNLDFLTGRNDMHEMTLPVFTLVCWQPHHSVDRCRGLNKNIQVQCMCAAGDRPGAIHLCH